MNLTQFELSPHLLDRLRASAKKALDRLTKKWAPPRRMSIIKWANTYRYLSPVEAGRAGKYSLSVTPYLEWPDGPLDAIDDPNVRTIVCMKSAQVAWTSGVVGNTIGKWIDIDPSPILLLFPKEGAAKDYASEKLEPMISATARLAEKVDLKSRKASQTQLRKVFAGGFLKLVGSNSPAAVKSTPTPRVIVEEPDDCNANLRGQGDAIKLAKERIKTYVKSRTKVIIGGTPTIKDISAVEAEMKTSDQRVGMIPCHSCGEEHVLSFDHLDCHQDESLQHEIYGSHDLERAFYACPHCGTHWNDAEKNSNVKRGRWVATAPFTGTAGFYLNELYSPFPGSSLSDLVRKRLEALHAFAQGDAGPLIAYTNSSLGLPYAYKGDEPVPDELEAKALDYVRGTVPAGGLILTAGVDVQHTWLEIVIRAWGRGEESWLVLHERIDGRVIDIQDPCWKELDALLLNRYPSEKGFSLGVAAVSIDCSDGSTSDVVYQFVRERQFRSQVVMAVKGSSSGDAAELFVRPSEPKDRTGRRMIKADKYGVRVYMVGVSRAKDMLIGENGRCKLQGVGPLCWHTYKQNLAVDYYKQLVAEVKAPVRGRNGSLSKQWAKKIGERNEVLDCEVYALHASRAVRVHTMLPPHWDAVEARLAQVSLFDTADPPADVGPKQDLAVEAPAKAVSPVEPKPKPKPKKPMNAYAVKSMVE